jgi:hypothetical protein
VIARGLPTDAYRIKSKIYYFPYFRGLEKTSIAMSFFFLTQRNSPGLISLQRSVGVEHKVCGGPELFDMSGSDSSKACLLNTLTLR